MSGKLEKVMTKALTQLLVMEGFEATDDFYVEFGFDLKKTLSKTLSKEQVTAAKEKAKRELVDING